MVRGKKDDFLKSRRCGFYSQFSEKKRNDFFIALELLIIPPRADLLYWEKGDAFYAED